MTIATHLNISPAEWRVMRVLWTLKSATTSEIISQLPDSNDWGASTIKTLIGRLVKKGYLQKDQHRRPFLYRPIVDEEKTMVQEAVSLLNSFCVHRRGEVLADSLSETDLTQSACLALIKILQDKAKTAPQRLTCNCVRHQRSDC